MRYVRGLKESGAKNKKNIEIIFPKKLNTSFKQSFKPHYKFIGECSVLKNNYIMDENDSLYEYNKIPLGHNRINGAVYSKIYFKVEICSAH